MTPLLKTPQWILVLLVKLPTGKTDKIPCDFRTFTPGINAHDPQFWTDHTTATALAARMGPEFTTGFVLTENDPFFCLDIDNCALPDGSWSKEAASYCAQLPNCTIEVSQSGRGLHVWGQGIVPPHTKKRVDLGIELYTEKRFIAVGRSQVGEMTEVCTAIAAFAATYFPPRATVAVGGDGPDPSWRGPTDDADLLRRAMQSRSARSAFGNGASFDQSGSG